PRQHHDAGGERQQSPSTLHTHPSPLVADLGVTTTTFTTSGPFVPFLPVWAQFSPMRQAGPVTDASRPRRVAMLAPMPSELRPIVRRSEERRVGKGWWSGS